ncbi:MAG: hypothetical protein JWR63_1811, partial [Conexibacter sp.]|nr:hypothetical protein [Conexibacter sp.]
GAIVLAAAALWQARGVRQPRQAGAG